MPNNIKGRNVRVDIGATYGAPIVVTTVSQAGAALVTAPAHGLAEWSAGYFDSVPGMVPIEGQGAIVVAPATDTFVADGLDTSSYPPLAGNTTFVPVTSWLTLAECTSYQVDVSSGSQRMNSTTILDTQARSRPGLLSEQTLTLNLIPTTVPTSALRCLQAAALAQASLVVRITHADGALRVCRGDPSYPNEGATASAIGTGTFALTLRGLFLQLAGAPPLVIPPPSGSSYSDVGFDDAGYDDGSSTSTATYSDTGFCTDGYDGSSRSAGRLILTM
jgi:hypothetical protein